MDPAPELVASSGPGTEPPSSVSALRRAVLRGLLAGLAGAGTCALLAAALDQSAAGILALQGFFAGGILGAVSLIEGALWGSEESPASSRVLAVGAAVWVTTTLLAYGALLQSVYLSVVLRGDGNAAASKAVEVELLYALDDPAPLVAVFSLVGLMFALTSCSRGWGLRAPEAGALCAAGALPLAAAILFGTSLCSHMIDGRFVFAALAAGTALLPVMRWAGDWIEQRFTRVRCPLPARRRSLAWACVAAWGVLGPPLAYAWAQARATAREDYEEAYNALVGEARWALASMDPATAYPRCMELRKLPLGIFHAREVRDLWLESAWWIGRPGPPELDPDELERVASWDADPILRALRSDLRLRQLDDAAGAYDDLVAATSAPDCVLEPWVYLRMAELLAQRKDVAGAEAQLELAEAGGAEPEELARVRGLLPR